MYKCKLGIGKYLPTYLFQHMMPYYFQKCNIMMTCGMNQIVNNDDLID